MLSKREILEQEIEPAIRELIGQACERCAEYSAKIGDEVGRAIFEKWAVEAHTHGRQSLFRQWANEADGGEK
jgi:hypothetical protein